MQVLQPFSIGNIPIPKFAIGDYLVFPKEGIQLCIGMIYKAESDDEGWWYFFNEPGFGECGSHETDVEQSNRNSLQICRL